ncbi:MAG: PepSY domain-containing protein [Desulfurococcales archaeon]|nr:PepSY domain-containing protein [Desulfurococcales archaeon]
MIKIIGIGKSIYAVIIAIGLIAVVTAGVMVYPALAASKTPQSMSTPKAVNNNDGPNVEVQEPSYKGSIAVPQTIQNGNFSEAQEQAMLKNLAKITPASASKAALAKVNGTVIKVSLEDENGYLVYSVIIKAHNGTIFDVKVDAGNGNVLYISQGGPENVQEVGGVTHETESAIEGESAVEVEK